MSGWKHRSLDHLLSNADANADKLRNDGVWTPAAIIAELCRRLKLATDGLRKIKTKDGMGADLSPSGPCYDIADEALQKIEVPKS